jgi:HEPN domain-containing protein
MAVDSYVHAAFRHADDSRRLHRDGRYDNAVYLAGYVVETTLKAWLVAATGRAQYTHNLMTLETQALAATIVGVDIDARFPEAAVRTLVTAGWTEQSRYWSDGSRLEDESRAIQAAVSDVVDRTLVPLVLDGVLVP